MMRHKFGAMIAIGMAVAVVTPCPKALATTVEECRDQAKYPTLKERGNCLEKTGDVKAIAVLYGLAMEIAAVGIRAVANDDFWGLAANAGAVGAWTDHKPILELARSKDIFSQMFAMAALRHSLADLYLGPTKKREERKVRYLAIQKSILDACESHLQSDEHYVRQEAEECVDSAKTKFPDADYSLPKCVGPCNCEAGLCTAGPGCDGGLSTRFGLGGPGPKDEPKKQDVEEITHHWCHTINGPIELCLPGKLGTQNVDRDVTILIRKQLGSAFWLNPETTGWEKEYRTHRPDYKILQKFTLRLFAGERLLQHTPHIFSFTKTQFLIYFPIVGGKIVNNDEDIISHAFDKTRVITYRFDSEKKKLSLAWTSPVCSGECYCPQIATRHNFDQGKFTTIDISLETRKDKPVYHFTWSNNHLEMLQIR